MTPEEEELLKKQFEPGFNKTLLVLAYQAYLQTKAIREYCFTHCPSHKERFCTSACPLFEYKKLMEKTK